VAGSKPTSSRRSVSCANSPVAAEAEAGETVVSSTVRDLVAGSGLRFQDRGIRALKGLPEEMHLYSVLDAR
jgi:class 3 adenylate cyclase